MNWDASQQACIQASQGDRLIIEAPPGHGKTAVVCGRVKYLIEDLEVAPVNIWIFSFTRTAVQEIRNRIGEFLEDPAEAYELKISTIDSGMWNLTSGFDDASVSIGDQSFSGYDLNIQKAIELIGEGKEGVLDFFQEMEHVIIDEAQDVEDVRSDLMEKILAILSPSCGFTILGDLAQAIYGFTSDTQGNNFLARILKREEIQQLRLTKNYRNKNPDAVSALNDAHDYSVLADEDPEVALPEIKNLMLKISDMHEPTKKDDGQSFVDYYSSENIPALILFRTRAEVLDASARLWHSETNHRLRIGDSTERTNPWIARVFSDYQEPRVSRQDFLVRWGAYVEPHPHYSDEDAERNWLDLYRRYGSGRDTLDMERLVKGLSEGRPPIEFVVSEQQLSGPILGTVHASKGREAGHVVFQMSKASNRGKDEGSDIEESRVCFVAFSRASEAFHIEQSKFVGGHKHRERIIRMPRTKGDGNPAVQVQFGGHGDVDPTAHVAKENWPDNEENQKNLQDYLWENAFAHTPLQANNSAASGWRYNLNTKREMSDIQCFGKLDDSVNRELFEIAKSKFAAGNSFRPGSKINYLHMIGATTTAISKESDLRRTLIDPYSKSGLFLSPVIFGFTNVYFQKKKFGRRGIR